MNNLKKVLSLLIIITILSITACSTEKEQSLIKNSYFDNTEKILIYKGASYKEIKDVEEFKTILKNIKGEKLDTEDLKDNDMEKSTTYKIIFSYKNSNEERQISFKKNKMLYNENWYNIDKDINNIYDKITYKEKIDKKLQIAKLKKETRKNLDLNKALIGNWEYNDGSSLEITKKHLIYKTKQKNRKFKYKMDNMKNNKVLLTAYKDVLFTNNTELFQMEILIDDTKNHIILKKKMLKGNMEYKNKLIYIDTIDDEEVELGSFDNLFFIENEDK